MYNSLLMIYNGLLGHHHDSLTVQYSTGKPDGGWLTLTQQFEKIFGSRSELSFMAGLSEFLVKPNHSSKGKFIRVSTTKEFKLFYTQKTLLSK